MSGTPSSYIIQYPVGSSDTSPPYVSTTIQAIYGFPTVALMIYLIIFFGVRKSYSAPFYRIVQFDLAVNVACYLNSWITMRVGNIPMFVPYLKGAVQMFPLFMDYSRYFANYFFHLQFFSAVYISAHRILIMRAPIWCSNYWKKTLVAVIILALVLSLVGNMFLVDMISNRVMIINGVLTRVLDSEKYSKESEKKAYLSALYFVVLISFGFVSAHSVSRTKKNQYSSYITRKLTIVTVVYLILYAGILSWTILSYLNSRYEWLPKFFKENNFTLLAFGSDLMTLSLPYILFIFDANIHRDIFKKQHKVVQINTLLTRSS